MPHWSQKHAVYKAGVIGLCGGFVLFLIGFGAPAWMKFDKGFYSGLWMKCDSELSNCASYNTETIVCVVGIIGATVFGVKKPRNADLTWAFGLVVTACCIALICAFLIALSPPATTQNPPVASYTTPVGKSFPVIQMGYEATPWTSSSGYNPPTGGNNIQVVNAPPNQRVAQNYYAPTSTAGYGPPARSHDRGSQNYYTPASNAEHDQPTQSYGPGSQSYYTDASARPYPQERTAYATGTSGSPLRLAQNNDDRPPPYESHFQNYNERRSYGNNYQPQTNRTYNPHHGHRREDREVMQSRSSGDEQIYI